MESTNVKGYKMKLRIEMLQIKKLLFVNSSFRYMLLGIVFCILCVLYVQAQPEAQIGNVIEVRVAASEDDGEENNRGEVIVSSPELELVYDTSNQLVGLRFSGVNIPKNAIITRAYIQFVAAKKSSDREAILTIQGEASGSALTFSNSPNDISLRGKTFVTVPWHPNPWLASGSKGLDQQTSDISTIVQEIVSKRSWEAGNSLVFTITGSGKRVAISYDGDSSKAPLLHIEYNVPAGNNNSTQITPLTVTDSNLKVAFIGDQGLGVEAESVLKLIKNERADMVLHQGDFEYTQNPDAWDNQINNTLGADFPYFASVGNHDIEKGMWPKYQQKLLERLSRISGANCSGDLGVNSACTYRGLFFILSGIDVVGSNHEAFIRHALDNDNSLWRICSWHKNQRLMQVGGKGDSTGWGVYEACREGGAIVATGHEHSYSRTHLMSNFETQVVASKDNTLVLQRGESFVFVSGLGGRSVRDQELSGDWWASIYTSDQGADYGALFCTFNVDGQTDKAECYFKDIQDQIPDRFTVISGLEPD